MTLARRFEGRKVGFEILKLVDWIRPVLLARLPEPAQALFVSNRVLDDGAADALRVGKRHAKANRSPVVLHEQHMVCDPKPRSKLAHHAREIVEGIFKARRRGRAAVAQARIIRSD